MHRIFFGAAISRTCAVLLALGVCLVSVVHASKPLPGEPASTKLEPHAYKPLPVGSITPKGWLLKQLELQAEGLGGHLALFWNDVMNSSWIGGGGDGGLHERVPYWLNGMVPLAFLLKNAGVEELAPVTGIYKAPRGVSGYDGIAPICQEGLDMDGQDIAGGAGYAVSSKQQCHDDCAKTPGCYAFVFESCTQPQATCWLKGGNGPTSTHDCRCYSKVIPKPLAVKPMEQVEKYIDYILAHQSPDGWLGPQVNPPSAYWGPSNVLQALYQYAEGAKDQAKFKNATTAILNHLMEQKRRMAHVHLNSWAAARWIDLAMTAEWLLDNADVGDHEGDLLELIGMLHDQGHDWEQWFEHFTGNAGGHNVDNAQGLKSAAVYSRYKASATYEGLTMRQLSQRRMVHLDEKYGLPTGMFNGDEFLPSPATRNPSRGIELCGVVEAMFSYNTMFSIHGDAAFAERAEKIAYNALPATWASPKGGDMWAHQYLQAVNEINAIKADPHVWTHDEDTAEAYGLEPNYGCCTANFHQGWPKFASMLMYSTADGGAAVAIYAPASAVLPGGVTIDVDTAYPFEDQARVTVHSSKEIHVYLRIPSWAQQATVNGKHAESGTMWKGRASIGTTIFTVDFYPTVRLDEWDNGAVSVHRGALMYSLPIAANYTMYAHHFGSDDMSSDYYLQPTSAWKFALDVDPRRVKEQLMFADDGYKAGAAPFNHSNWPSHITAQLRPLPAWGETMNSASEPPTSPACEGQGAPAGAPAGARCGAAEAHQLAPHGGTDLRIGEMPLAAYPGIETKEDRTIMLV